MTAGCSTVKGLRKFIEERSKCRLYAFLHIASHGLASAGCAGLSISHCLLSVCLSVCLSVRVCLYLSDSLMM